MQKTIQLIRNFVVNSFRQFERLVRFWPNDEPPTWGEMFFCSGMSITVGTAIYLFGAKINLFAWGAGAFGYWGIDWVMRKLKSRNAKT
jgi:hypothetical protein